MATITLNRPEARNALTYEAKVSLLDALRDSAGDESIRALILTGAGTAFCAGQDLREHAARLEQGGALDTVAEHYNPIVMTITGMPKPVIAAVNGVAAGAGAALAFACDFRIAARRASLAERLAAGPTRAYAAIKESLLYSASHTLHESLANEAELQRALGDTRDHQAATQAFPGQADPGLRRPVSAVRPPAGRPAPPPRGPG